MARPVGGNGLYRTVESIPDSIRRWQERTVDEIVRATVGAARGLGLGLAAMVLAACGATAPPATAPADIVLGAPEMELARPVRDTELEPGVRYLLEDLVPGVLDLQVTAPEPALANYGAPGVALLYIPGGIEDGAWFIDVASARVPLDPYLDLTQITTLTEAREATSAAPSDLLGHITELPFVRVDLPVRPITVAGTEGWAVDITIGDLDPSAPRCVDDNPEPCALVVSLVEAGISHVVGPGDRSRYVLLDHPAGPLLVIQNLKAPQAQAALDTVAFVPSG